MSSRTLIILNDGEQTSIPLDRERIVLGRDPSCDHVLAHESISRKHAAVVYRHGAVYIENISSTGKILKDGEPIEYAELEEGQEIRVGPFVLYWQNSTSAEQSPPVHREDNNATQASPNAPSQDPPADIGFIGAPVDQAPALDGDPAPDAAQLMEMPVDGQIGEQPSESAPSDGSSEDPNGRTAIVSQSVSPRMRIVKGDTLESGREIRLQGGPHWIVGRSSRAHIQIDHPKFSRQHFKIVKIGDNYRVQDMGSANGTRLNGVAVTDAPLQPFDTVQVGPVELQFVLVSQDAEHLAAGMNHSSNNLPAVQNGPMNFGEAGSDEKTRFAPPAPYNPANAGGYGGGWTPPQTPMASDSAPGPNSGGGDSQAKGPISKALVWYKAQPKPRQAMIAGAALILLAGIASQTIGSHDDGPTPASVQVPVAAASPAPSKLEAPNAADPRDISPEFFTLSADKQREIDQLYVKAERARAAKSWQEAYDSADSILKIVKKYKQAGSILDEAQSNLVERKLGSIAAASNNAADAALECKEKNKYLMDNGKKALSEKRWQDAATSFQTILTTCDPNDMDVLKHLQAAMQQNPALVTSGEIPTGPASFQDPDAEARQAERDFIDSYKTQLQQAKARIQEGNAKEASPILRDLVGKLQNLKEDYDNGKRAPASIRSDLSNETSRMLTDAQAQIDTVKSMLKSEYQTEMADAEQHVANRQYALAREIYDRILRNSPDFDDALEARNRLYDKILAEARNLYAESAIYEWIGNVDEAVDGYAKTKELLTNVADPMAVDYYKRSLTKLRRLRPQ